MLCSRSRWTGAGRLRLLHNRYDNWKPASARRRDARAVACGETALALSGIRPMELRAIDISSFAAGTYRADYWVAPTSGALQGLALDVPPRLARGFEAHFALSNPASKPIHVEWICHTGPWNVELTLEVPTGAVWYPMFPFQAGATLILPDVAHCVAGKINSAYKLHLVIESIRPDTRHPRSSTVPAPADGAGGSPIG